MRPAVILLLAAAACAPVPKLSAVGGTGTGPANVVEERGVELRALANAWQGYPPWLTRRFTPIWVHVVNHGSESFDVTLASMSLVDERGEVHGAVQPPQVAREIFGEREGDPRIRFAASPDEPPQPAAAPPNPTVPLPTTPRPPSTDIYFGLAPYDYVWNPVPIEGNGTNPNPFGFQSPFDGPFGAETMSRDASAIVAPALREGRLLPNTRAEGFVYFRAELRATRLTFKLDARNEREGDAPLQMHIIFSPR